MNLEDKPKLLLHSCCGPCSTAVVERLVPRYWLTVFFYNPNITDGDEYEKRKENQIDFIRKFNAGLVTEPPESKVEFLEGKYDPKRYLDLVRGLEQEPEGGARCTECFKLRLSEAAQEACRLGFDCFATTLSVSPHKNFPLIAQIGETEADLRGISFLAEDFKKKAGYQRSIAMSKAFDLYRQNFCGCEFAKSID